MDKTEPTREEILKTINKIIKEDFPCNWEFKEIAERVETKKQNNENNSRNF